MKHIIKDNTEIGDLIEEWGKPGVLTYPCTIEVLEDEPKQRTNLQNKAIHKYLSLLSAELNTAGLDMQHTLKEGVSIPWSETLVKELLWHSVQTAMFGTTSTAKLTTEQVSAVYDVINRKTSDLGVSVEFPDKETLRLNQTYGEKK
jgi:hypothetical protein